MTVPASGGSGGSLATRPSPASAFTWRCLLCASVSNSLSYGNTNDWI